MRIRSVKVRRTQEKKQIDRYADEESFVVHVRVTSGSRQEDGQWPVGRARAEPGRKSIEVYLRSSSNFFG